MPLLQTTTGFETFQQSSAKVYAFHMPSRQFPGKELNLNIVARAGGGVVTTVGLPTSIPAAPGLSAELGRWTSATYELPENMLVKVFAHRSGGFGQMRVMASMILRMREQAALRRVSAILTQSPRASLTRANFEGRFDVLTLPEAMMLGVTVPPSFRQTFEHSFTSRAFEVQVLAREITPPEVMESRRVETASGETVEVASARRRRAIDL